MDERQVKAAVLQHVRRAVRRGSKPVVTAEFSLGNSGVRADLAVFGETSIGVEIKTARDSLRRLETQMAAYSKFFEHAIAVIAPNHLRNLKFDHLSGASLWTYTDCGELRVLVDGEKNPIDTEVICSALTQVERRKYDFMSAMEKRYSATSERFWIAVARRSINATDLNLLSRFSDNREMARLQAVARDSRWATWMAAQPSQSSSVSSAAFGVV